MKKVLVWADSPTSPTGFGNVVKNILNNFPKDQYEFVIYGINHTGSKRELGYKIYGAHSNYDIYGYKGIRNVIKKEQPDVLFLINDIWVIQEMLSHVKQDISTVVYFPVDAEDHDPKWYSCLDRVDKAVVYNEFGKRVATQARADIEYEIIEHGVDGSVFYKNFETRLEAKKALFKSPELHDSFIVLNAGRNQPRKRLDITLRSFREFAKDKPDAFLYMHSGAKDSHIDTLRLAKELDILPKLIMTTDQEGVPNLDPADLNLLYNACDVGINTGLGEGFGLPNAEHAATGAVQIVPDHSALSDLYKDCGILVPADILFTLDNISTTAKMVSVQDVTQALELVYRDRELYERYSKLCYEKFNTEEYSWKYISQQWMKLFDEL